MPNLSKYCTAKCLYFAKPGYLLFHRLIFAITINTEGEKFTDKNFSPMRVGGEIGKILQYNEYRMC